MRNKVGTPHRVSDAQLVAIARDGGVRMLRARRRQGIESARQQRKQLRRARRGRNAVGTSDATTRDAVVVEASGAS